MAKVKQDGGKAEKQREELARLANAVRDESSADVHFFSGPIRMDSVYGPGSDTMCMKAISEIQSREKNAILLLCTNGGDPDAAYRMARMFLSMYEEFTVLIHGSCFSAGTLITLGAHVLVLSPFAMMGPLDTQIAKADELFESVSGLTGVTALDALRQQAYKSFEHTLVDMKLNLPNEVTLKTSIDVAVRLTTGLYAPIFSQIDPLKLGEDRRALDIAREYGDRLVGASKNAKEGTLEKLLASYPSHGFIIDPIEAKELFDDVRDITQPQGELLKFLGQSCSRPTSEPFYRVLSTVRPENQIEEKTDEKRDDKTNQNGNTDKRNTEAKVKGA